MKLPTTQSATHALDQAADMPPPARGAGGADLPARVVRLSSLAEVQPCISQWNAMARVVPFRRWEWLESWWRHYGESGQARTSRELFVLAVFDAQRTLLGLAPWYIERSASQGRVLRFLGTGEVCSEYLSLLCVDGKEEIVARGLANWLAASTRAEQHDDHGQPSAERWDVLKLSGVAADDLAVERLLVQLARQGSAVHRRPGMSCWRIELPSSWEEYLSLMSKSHRKQLRRLDRDFFRSGRARMHWVHGPDQLEQALAVLVRLHQSRWNGRGWPGCFASERFLKFHREVAWRMLAFDALLMSWLEIDGRAVAAEYHLAGNGIVYAYQSGIAPGALGFQPGHLSHLATIRRAIERGDREFDFLRGDEPYKSHWRAAPRGMLEVRIVPPRIGPRIRQGIWAAGHTVINQLRSGWQRTKHLIQE
ncbi:MAG TPA: GNAT family N-acetyltransferase [Pirellulales bacterium]|nr:GNAT family N-acetyltransferase [Pirellulales bacterium]